MSSDSSLPSISTRRWPTPLNCQRPVLVLIVDSGSGDADNDAASLLEDPAIKERSDRMHAGSARPCYLAESRDGGAIPRHRYALLVCLSPGGVIVSRDEKPITQETGSQTHRRGGETVPDLDPDTRCYKTRLVPWSERAVATNPNQTAGKLNLADFLLAHHNAREAIPLFASVAHSDAGRDKRSRAGLGRPGSAHLWIAEPEKGRHEAKDLIASLGPTTLPKRWPAEISCSACRMQRKAFCTRPHRNSKRRFPRRRIRLFAKQAAEALAKLPKEAK